jgi:pilus assembly protein Flp/PilA
MHKTFLKNQRGQGMVEYALILVLVAVIVIAALTIMGPRISFIFDQVSGAIKCPAQYNAWVTAGKPGAGAAYDAMNTCWQH